MVSMKKLLVFLVLFLFVFSPNVYAIGEDFHLPSPGMLPTNPLYVLKAMRDNLVLAITQNPNNRAELLIFSSNKSLAAALELSKQGKNSEAGVSLEKSLTLFSRGMMLFPKVSKTNQQNLNIAALIAVRAHEQMDENIIAKASVADRQKLLGFHANLGEMKDALMKKIFPTAQKQKFE